MAVTTSPRFGVTRWSAGGDAFNRTQMDASHSAIETKGAIYLQSVAASRPAAGTVGRYHYATDTTAFTYDDGTGWRSVSDPSTVLLTATQTLTNKTISGASNTLTNIAQASVTSLTTDLGLKAPLASPTFTGTVVLPSGTSIGTVTNIEIGYLDGVTSAVQTQIDGLQTQVNAKSPSASPTFTGTVVLPSGTSIGTVTNIEIGYLDGVTSAIQTQIDSKQASDADLTAIAALAGTTGFLKKSAADTWVLDTATYISAASPTFTGTVTLAPTTAGDSSITGTLSTSGSGKFSGLGAITICTSSTRPGSPSAGQVIYETDTALFFGYNSTAWSSIGGGGAAYQTTAPTATLVGALWVDSDDTASSLNTNDFLLKSEAAVTYATKTELGNAGYSPFLLMGA